MLIKTDQLGTGEESLGKLLMKGFLFALTELPVPPKRLIFLNSGVKLAVQGSNTLSDLRHLAAKGTKLCACGTCLNFYELTEKLAVGEIVDMMAIVRFLSEDPQVISL